MHISMDKLYVTEHDCEHNGSNMPLSIGYSWEYYVPTINIILMTGGMLHKNIINIMLVKLIALKELDNEKSMHLLQCLQNNYYVATVNDCRVSY